MVARLRGRDVPFACGGAVAGMLARTDEILPPWSPLERDALAELDLLRPVVKGLGRNATLHLAEGADHSFHVLKSSGRNDREVLAEILDAFAAWAEGIIR